MFDFGDPNILIGDNQLIRKPDRRTICPEHSIKAWNAWALVADKTINFYRRDEEFWCDWGSCDRTHSNGLKEKEKYVKAYKYLPNLLMRFGRISVQPEEFAAFDLLASNYQERALWLDYYLLEDLSALTELGFKPPKKRQYKPGKVAATNYTFIKDVWTVAKLDRNPVCQWVLGYDSPAQIWFGLCANHLERWWKVGRFKDGGKEDRYKEEKRYIDALEHPRRIDIKVVDSTNPLPLPFFDAFCLSKVLLIKSYEFCKSHSENLEAQRSQMNYIRKNQDVHRLGATADGHPTLGKYEVEGYFQDRNTEILTLKSKKKGFG
jgi:hypothetical protein